jgi:hypothetical protein
LSLPNHSYTEVLVELIIMILAAFPLGYFIRSRNVAYVAYIALHSFVFSFQSMELTREWVGGNYSAYPKDSQTVAWSYAVVNLAIYAVGLGLVTLGHRVADHRRAKVAGPIDLTV